jgi:ubiquinone/menaquinone biosynthesis C-methylase UbiE
MDFDHNEEVHRQIQGEEDISYVIPVAGKLNAGLERQRLNMQDLFLTPRFDHLPSQFVPRLKSAKEDPQVVLDIACGTGGYILALAKEFQKDYSHIQLKGYDINREAIAYCQELARNYNNVEFAEMNIIERLPDQSMRVTLDIDDNSADYMFIRLIFAAMPKSCWPSLLQECYRILKPGGVLRIIEQATMLYEHCPVAHELSEIQHKALWLAGRTFSEYETALVPALFRFFRESPFTLVEQKAKFIDFSSGVEPEHSTVIQNLQLLIRTLRPLTLAYHVTTAEYYDTRAEQMIKAFEEKDFSGAWGLNEFIALALK